MTVGPGFSLRREGANSPIFRFFLGIECLGLRSWWWTERFMVSLSRSTRIRFAGAALVAPAIVLLPSAADAATCVTSGTTSCTFTFTGATQKFTVPAGVSTIKVDLFGASGGDDPSELGRQRASGGNGAHVSALMSVGAGTEFNVEVGQQGRSESVQPAYNGGGAGGTLLCDAVSLRGSGGGGATDLRSSSGSLASRVLVAAGGGGAGFDGSRSDFCTFAGGSGGASEANGSTSNSGRKATGAAPGTGGNGDFDDGAAGGLGGGGAGADGAGGGGGGLFGGGGGGLNMVEPRTTGGGGGGSNFVGGAGVVSASVTNGANDGNGRVVITFGSFVGCAGLPVTVNLNFGDRPTGGDDVIVGTAGNDIIDAGSGNDVVCGGDGNDVLRGGPGNDKLLGEAGKDVLKGGPGAKDVCKGGPAVDRAKKCERVRTL
jgi:hypothetical protein